jgi:hypothetical protein
LGVGRTIAIALADSGREEHLLKPITESLQFGDNLVVDKNEELLNFETSYSKT